MFGGRRGVGVVPYRLRFQALVNAADALDAEAHLRGRTSGGGVGRRRRPTAGLPQ